MLGTQSQLGGLVVKRKKNQVENCQSGAQTQDLSKGHTHYTTLHYTTPHTHLAPLADELLWTASLMKL